MKIPGFGGGAGAVNAKNVDLPPAATPGKTAGTPDLPNQPGNSSLPFLNNAKAGPLNFASNAFDGLSTLASLTGSGGSQKNGPSREAGSPDGLQGGGLLQQIMMLTGLQQLLGSGNKAQEPEQPTTPASSQRVNNSGNPLEQLMQMLQQLLQQMMGLDKGKGADGGGESGGNAPQAPTQGATDNNGQQGGMMQNLLSMLGLTSLLQGLLGGGEGQSPKNTQN